MRFYVTIGLMWVLLLGSTALFAAQPTLETFGADNELSQTLRFAPARDDADDDSIVYEYGFEEGWNGWTTLDLTDVDPMWHITESHAFEDGSSWWCGDEEFGGYDDHWLQYLDTPALDLSDQDNLTLTFKLFYASEDPEVQGPPDPDEWPDYDAWDGCNVWISTNGGEDWTVINPAEPEYNYESLFSFGYEWNMGPDIPGWCGSSDGWLDAEFDLSEYAQDNVLIRWAFCSDPGWHTGGENDPDREAIGMLVDNMRVMAGDQVLWENTGDEAGEMETYTMAEVSGNYWEITDADAQSGEFCAHCPIEESLWNVLVSPAIELLDDEWYTYFDFWVIANTRMSDSDDDGSLDDLFRVQLKDEDSTEWIDIVYDYGSEDHPDFYGEWGYYGPDTWFRNDLAEWKVKLNLSNWAGHTIKLRWVAKTDSVMDDPQGSGFWIDDVRVLSTQQKENDVGIEWVHLGYPMSMGIRAAGQVKVENYGLATQNPVQKYWRIDNERPTPITPWQGIEPGKSETLNFYLQRYAYCGLVDLEVYTKLSVTDDQNTLNDTVKTEALIYPEGIYELGYDAREWTTRWTFPADQGPAVLFTPGDEGIDGNFDVQAVKVRWSNADQENDVETTIVIRADNNGNLGDVLYQEDIMVTVADLQPNVMIIDLTSIEQLQDISGDFWVYFIIHGDDGLPQVMGRRAAEDDPYWGSGHYFATNGANVIETATDEWQVQAFITSPSAGQPELIASREELLFEVAEINQTSTMRFTLFCGGSPVTIEDVNVDNDAYRLDFNFDTPYTLMPGTTETIEVEFTPTADEFYEAVVTFTTDDADPPVVHLTNTTDVESDGSTLPNQYNLGEAYPNPFNATAVIPFALPAKSEVTLAVFDISGRKVATLVSGIMDAGNHSVSFDAGSLANGIYIYKLEAADFSLSRKVALIK